MLAWVWGRLLIQAHAGQADGLVAVMEDLQCSSAARLSASKQTWAVDEGLGVRTIAACRDDHDIYRTGQPVGEPFVE